MLADGIERLEELQERLYADDRWSVLIVLQGMDAAGKDSLIKHVMSGVNPQGVEVHSFKQPSDGGIAARFPLAHRHRSCRRAGASAFSTARTMRTCWWCACIPKCWRARSFPRGSTASISGATATTISAPSSSIWRATAR